MKAFFSKFWAGWKELAGYFADFQSRWLLTVFYFTLALPFGVLTRLFTDPMQTRQPPTMSGWTLRTEHKDTLDASKRLF
jgi:hypothetical protein